MIRIDISLIFFISYTIKGRRKMFPIKGIRVYPYFYFLNCYRLLILPSATSKEWLDSSHLLWTQCSAFRTIQRIILAIIWGNRDYELCSWCFIFTVALWTSYHTWVEVHRSFNKCKPRELINHVPNSTTVVILYFALL